MTEFKIRLVNCRSALAAAANCPHHLKARELLDFIIQTERQVSMGWPRGETSASFLQNMICSLKMDISSFLISDAQRQCGLMNMQMKCSSVIPLALQAIISQQTAVNTCRRPVATTSLTYSKRQASLQIYFTEEEAREHLTELYTHWNTFSLTFLMSFFSCPEKKYKTM